MEKKTIRCFNLEYLQQLIIRDNATLIGDYDTLKGSVIIKLKCSCNNEFEKKFSDIAYYGGAFCKICTIKNKSRKIKETNINKYGVENVSQVDDIKKKKEETYLEHYGMHPKKTTEVQEKYINTCLKKYGCINSGQAKEVKDKIKKTFDKKYGGHPMYDSEVKNKIKETCLDKYGVEHPMFDDNVKNKIKITCLEKYGVEYSMQTKETHEKAQNNGKKYKKYTMPSGNIINIQGYEPFALNDLLKSYNENAILTNRRDIPRITYTYNNKTKYYFPDIYLPSENKIIEVKSSWTYQKDYEKNQIKGQATKEMGYNYEIWVYNNRGDKIIY